MKNGVENLQSVIFTSNKNFGKWEKVFGDRTWAEAIIDRAVHYGKIISIQGESYRVKNREEGEEKYQNMLGNTHL